MRKEAVLAMLAAKAASLGVDPPSEAKFESWITKGLIDGASAKGIRRGIPPQWSFDEKSVRAAIEIIGLEARGAKRTAQLRIGLAVAGFKVDPDELLQNVASEASRSFKRMRRNGWRNFSSRSFANEPSDRLLKRADQVAPILKDEGWAMPREAILEAGFTILIGSSSDASIPNSVMDGARSLLSEHFGELLGDQLAPALTEMQDLVQFMPGIAGDAENTDFSLEERLSSVKAGDLVKAISIAQTFANATKFEPILPLSNVTKLVIETAFKAPNWQAILVGVLTVQLPLLEAILGPDFATLFAKLVGLEPNPDAT
ncbi:hypothetical protein [Henriciella marina]|uniref:hypothetical protein n=1 Tax=Henriciella marina TaxID=453851 RepID=UPI00036A76E6|nr:hypothetical protein [Henriciella marina]